MPDYLLKSKVINSPLLETYKKWSKANYQFAYTDNDMTIEQLRVLNDLAYYESKLHPVEWKECKRISHAHCQRVIRLRKRIANMVLFSDCLFLTFNFTDDVISSTNDLTRRRYVTRFLNSLNCEYVANIDFGSTRDYIDRHGNKRTATGREHYHALVQIKRVKYTNWKYGQLNGQRIRNHTDDLQRLSRYIAKLTNHAIKVSNKRCVLIYSRKKYIGDNKND